MSGKTKTLVMEIKKSIEDLTLIMIFHPEMKNNRTFFRKSSRINASPTGWFIEEIILHQIQKIFLFHMTQY